MYGIGGGVDLNIVVSQHKFPVLLIFHCDINQGKNSLYLLSYIGSFPNPVHMNIDELTSEDRQKIACGM